MIYAVLDHPDLDGTDLSALRDGDVRRLADVADPAGRGHRAHRPRVRPALRPDRVRRHRDVDEPGRPPTRRPRAPHRRAASRCPACASAVLDDDGNEVEQGTPGEICVQGAERDAGLLQAARAHGGDDRRRLAAHRRRRRAGRRGPPVHRRPQEGHDRVRRVQRVPPRDRGRAHVATRACRRPPSSASPTRSGARRSRRSSWPGPGPRVDVEALRALVRERKGGVYAPKSIEVVDSLPLTAVGKADKKVLRARYWGDRARGVN